MEEEVAAAGAAGAAASAAAASAAGGARAGPESELKSGPQPEHEPGSGLPAPPLLSRRERSLGSGLREAR